MQLETTRVTVDAFDQFIARPENADRLFEYIGGEIVEVPSNPRSSEIASILNLHLLTFVRANKLGRITGEQGGYMVAGERYAPDVAYISYARQPELPETGYNPNPPDLAVEVLSPTDTERRLAFKLHNYAVAGTVVWVVDPKQKLVDVYVPGQPAHTLTEDDTLDGGTVLPGFTLAVRDIFS
jgi:Uma2 family endonuclease